MGLPWTLRSPNELKFDYESPNKPKQSHKSPFDPLQVDQLADDLI